MIIKVIEIYNIAAQPYYCWLEPMHTTLKQSHRMPHLHIKRKHFVTSYVQPVMQQYESTIV